jgi:hypothetical protein
MAEATIAASVFSPAAPGGCSRPKPAAAVTMPTAASDKAAPPRTSREFPPIAASSGASRKQAKAPTVSAPWAQESVTPSKTMAATQIVWAMSKRPKRCRA